MAPVAGSVELKFPVGILEKCQLLQSGETIELYGTNLKQGGSKRNVKADPVKIIAEKNDTFLSLHLKSSAMGAVFQRKVTDTWNCEIKAIGAHEGEESVTSESNDTNLLLLDTLSTNAELALNASQPETVNSATVKLEHPSNEEEDDDDDAEAFVDTYTYTMNTCIETTDLGEEAVPGTSTEDYSQEMTESSLDNKGESDVKNDTCPEEEDLSAKSSRNDTCPEEKDLSSKAGCTRRKSAAKVESPETRSNTRSRRSKDGDDMSKQAKTATKRKSSSTQRRPKRARGESSGVDVSDLKCEYCNRSWFTSTKGYTRHLNHCAMNPEVQASAGENDTEQQLFTCETCNMTTKSMDTLKRHKREVHNIQEKRIKKEKTPSQCAYCGKLFVHRSSINFHFKYKCPGNPDVRTPYRCGHCCAVFDSKEELATHQQDQHPNGFQVCCHVCGKVFKTRSGLYFHQIKLHNTGQKKKYECSYCDMAYFTSADLRQHEIKHKDERRYRCETCGNTYKYDQHLKRHINTVHLNKHNFTCARCGHGMEKASYLRSHICGRIRRKSKQSALQPVSPGSLVRSDVDVDDEVIEAANIHTVDVEEVISGQETQIWHDGSTPQELVESTDIVDTTTADNESVAYLYILENVDTEVIL